MTLILILKYNEAYFNLFANRYEQLTKYYHVSLLLSPIS